MEPSARIIDTQSVRAASRGYDGGKKIPGRKRHIITYILGLLLVVAVTAANVGDRDAAAPLLQRLRWLPREITLIWADGGSGGLINWAKEKIALTNPSMSSVRLTTSAHVRMADALAPSGP
ncbi:transposase [Streptomyces sp. A1547]|uniref:transposase n=1 Tax=Streptomyces sp. A1547 TaxID=2563105 RepID=UPI00144A7A62|nr:transposase [Streptomyces sp. A1547]